MKRNSYFGSPRQIAHCKRMGFEKRIVRDLKWFMGKVNHNGPVPIKHPELGPCWEWTGAKNNGGYGFFQIWRQTDKVRHVERMWMANRYSWVIHFGEIPNGLWVLHKCDNPTCVRPDHLFVGNNQQNQRDSHDKDRGYYKKGERHPRATISNEVAKQVKELLRVGNGTTAVARYMKLPAHTVENIKRGNSFAWL